MMTNEEVDAKVIEITMIEAQIKALKELVEAGKNELKAECDARQVDVIDTGANRVWYTVIVKNNFDAEKAKKFIADNNADVNDFFNQKTETRFNLKHILTR